MNRKPGCGRTPPCREPSCLSARSSILGPPLFGEQTCPRTAESDQSSQFSCLLGTCSPRIRELAVQPVLSVLTTAVLLLLYQAKGDNFDCPFDGIPKPAMLVVPPIGSYLEGFCHNFWRLDTIRRFWVLHFVFRTHQFAGANGGPSSVVSFKQAPSLQWVHDTFSNSILAHSYSYGAESRSWSTHMFPMAPQGGGARLPLRCKCRQDILRRHSSRL